MLYEDWESNSFNRFMWEHEGDEPWIITQSNVYEGAYCARSGNIDDEENSILKISMDVSTEDSIWFHRRVSSEATYDFLKFYIDDEIMGQWSGSESWDEVAFPVTTGEHTFKWEYVKDQAVSNGADHAWIDFIIFPDGLITTCDAGEHQAICEYMDVQLDGYAYFYEYVIWSTYGTGTFSDISDLDAIYYPGPEDITGGSVTLTLTAVDFDGESVSDHMTLTFDYLPEETGTPEGPDYVDLFVTTSTDYQIGAVTGADTYEWSLNPDNAGALDATDLFATITWDPDFIGTAELTAQAFNDCGAGLMSQPLMITIDNTVGLDEKDNPDIRVYPNPARERLFIQVPDNGQDWQVILFDLMGEEVAGQYVRSASGISSISLYGIAEGVYFVMIRNDNAQYTRKVVIR
jgi:hypothetical protein